MKRKKHLSGKLYASNDIWIEELVNDPDYKICKNGIILTRRDGGGHVTKKWRKLSSYKNDGYVVIRYKLKHLQVHRIIYRAFVGTLDPNLVINHLDCNPANNTPSNLELVTQLENNFHRLNKQ